jgi:SAM-dependent methyltransferase
VEPSTPTVAAGTGYQGGLGDTLRDYLLGLWTDAEADYRAQILEIVARERPADLLDLGCDDGSFTEQLSKAAGGVNRAVGVEIVEEARHEALQRGIEAVPGDLNAELPFESDSFDLVHANQVIEHVVMLDTFVGEIRRVLRPGGSVVVCTENLASWHNVAALVLGYMPFSLTNISTRGAIGNPFGLADTPASELEPSWFHTRVLTAVGLAHIFAAHGFDVVERFGAGYHPLPSRLARRAARRDGRHAAFIGVVARKQEDAATGATLDASAPQA